MSIKNQQQFFTFTRPPTSSGTAAFQEHPNLAAAQAASATTPLLLWAHYQNPSAADLQPLIATFNLHPLAVEDCLNGLQLPKVEIYPHHLFLILHYFHSSRHSSSTTQQTSEINCFLAANFVITISNQKLLNDQQLFFKTLLAKEIPLSSDSLLHAILDQVVDHKVSIIEEFEHWLEGEEEASLKRIHQNEIANLTHIRRELFSFRRSISYEREVFSKLYHRISPLISAEMSYYFRDLYDHLSKVYEMSELLREEIGTQIEIVLSIKNNRLAETSNQLNKTMKRLTLITTVFMPLTLLSGIGGMSEWSMIMGPENWRYSYPLFFLILLMVALLSLWGLKKIRWW